MDKLAETLRLDKPRFFKGALAGLWICVGRGAIGEGWTLAAAYESWGRPSSRIALRNGRAE